MDARVLARSLEGWRRGGAPLYAEVAAGIAALIEDETLPPGLRLPAERSLAQALAVSRGTIVAAYERLRDDGVVTTRHGSGTVVGTSPLPGGDRDAHSAASLTTPHIYGPILHPDDCLVNWTCADWDDSPPLPPDVLDLGDAEARRWLFGPGLHPTGLPPLREEIAGHLSAEGLPTEPNEVMVTTGAQQALTLLTQFAVRPGDTVVTEELTYPGIVTMLRTAGARIRTVPTTAQGVDVPALERMVAAVDPTLVYLMLDSHNPTGIVAPTLVRRRVAELADTMDALLVEDASLRPTQFDGALAPPAASYRRSGPGVVVGSLSKITSAALRVGWIRGPSELIARLARVHAIDELGGSVPSQLVALRALRRADELFPPRRAELATRHGRLREALAAAIPEWTPNAPRGGLSLWIDLGDADSHGLAQYAAREGLAIVPGTVAAPAGSHARFLRLPAARSVAELDVVVPRLARAWDRYRASQLDPDRVVALV